MQDNNPMFSDQQENINSCVEEVYANHMNDKFDINVSMDKIDLLISSLKCTPSSGPDGIFTAHLKHGNSLILRNHLASFYSIIFSWSIVPAVFNTGIIVPILKKATLNLNETANYRPITLCSVFAKIAEMCMLPKDKVHDNQFGFRNGRNTSVCCAMLNDILAYFVNGKSPVFICSLDAEKCFDLICTMAYFTNYGIKYLVITGYFSIGGTLNYRAL